MTLNCPCHSGLIYSECCKKYHEGEFPYDAERLMRSRYAAYSLGLADYIIETTLPSKVIQSKISILQFSNSTLFNGLEIVEFIESGDEAWVTFTAGLIDIKTNKDVSFTEKSHFLKVGPRWLYEHP